MKVLLVFMLLCNLNVLMSQNINTITLTIIPIIQNNTVQISHLNKDSVTIETLKFYLTNFTLIKSEKVVWQELESHHLIDASNSRSLLFKFNLRKNIEFDEIQFLLGTDSITNVMGVMGGALDPIKGMYWAWNSGYINFKFEGKSNSYPFEFHLGGYQSPHQTVQEIKLKITNTSNINITLNLSDFLNQLNLKTQHKIMSPGKEAQRLSKILATLFYIHD